MRLWRREREADPKVEAFFRRAVSVDVNKVKEAGKIDTEDRLKPLKRLARQWAKELRVPPGLAFNAIYYCVNDPSCDLDGLKERIREGGQDYIIKFLHERGVEV
jgi:hypothetical protein